MSDQWDAYLTNVNEHPAAILLDMGASDDTSKAERPQLLQVTFQLNNQDEYGLPTRDEFNALYPIEEAVAEAIEQALGAVHVGYMTTQGKRILCFYAASGEQLEEVTTAATARFTTHRWACKSQEDPDWEFYWDILYPTPYDMQIMNNQKVLKALSESGDSLEKPRTVTHWAYFPTDASRSDFVMTISSQNFEVKDLMDGEEPEDDRPFGVCFERVDPVDFDAINELTLGLVHEVQESGGTYDGWETSVESE
ncbi:DUF695 domain-containing protein [Bremerella cremea]|uniref:DUF695 domain-containing protein n=1 Tax=Bremerella cremea TaxID=1031537 RepID=UPI0031E8B654